MSQCSSARIRQMPELLPLTARLRCGCLDAVPALAGSEDHHRGAEPTRQRDLREERVLQHLHDNEAGPAHDVPRVYSLHGDNLVSTVPFRLSDLPSLPPIDAVLCSTPCYDRLEGDHREAQGLGIRGTQPEPVTCFVCKAGGFTEPKIYQETCTVGHYFILRSHNHPCAVPSPPPTPHPPAPLVQTAT